MREQVQVQMLQNSRILHQHIYLKYPLVKIPLLKIPLWVLLELASLFFLVVHLLEVTCFGATNELLKFPEIFSWPSPMAFRASGLDGRGGRAS